MNRNKLISRMKEIGVISKEPVILRSGKTSNFYCDVKKCYGYPDVLSAIADEVIKQIPSEATCIAVSGYGGLPLGSLVTVRMNLKLTSVRDAPKKHGRGGFIDGYVPTNEDAVVIIDDVLTTGTSIIDVLGKLKNTGAKTKSAVVVVKRGDANLPIPYSYIFDLNEIKDEV